MEVYESADFGVEIKGDNSPLTIADKRANDVITAILSEFSHRLYDYIILIEFYQ